MAMRNILKMSVVFLALSGVVALAQGAAPLAKPSYTAAQAKRGETAYMTNCASCHGDKLDNGEGDGAPALVGSSFTQQWNARPLGELYDFTATNMPASAPGSLSAGTTADIIAFLLSRNGVAAGTQELPSDPEKLKALAGPQ
jgi:mono/diheme cytochrome c family protein